MCAHISGRLWIRAENIKGRLHVVFALLHFIDGSDQACNSATLRSWGVTTHPASCFCKGRYLLGATIFTSPLLSYKGHVQTLIFFFKDQCNCTQSTNLQFKCQSFVLNPTQMKTDMYHILLTIELLNWITSCRRANDGLMFELWFIITLWRVCHILFTKAVMIHLS